MFNIFSNLKRKKSDGTITISELLKKIKSENINVTFCRSFLKKGTQQYDEYKVNNIEAISANCFNSINYRNAKYFKSSGFIYVDIDNFESKKAAIEYRERIVNNLPFVYACWLSISEKGLSILVKVNKCNQPLYIKIYQKLIELNVLPGLDTRVIDYKRLCCISQDSNIYVNDNAIPFDNLYQIHPDYLNWKTVIPDSEFENINTPAIYPDGKEYLEINLFKFRANKIENGYRTSTLGAISLQLIYLNPNAEFQQLLNGLKQFNKNYCKEPLTDKEVFNILNANFKKKDSIEISKYLKKKQVFFHRNCQLLKPERLKVINQLKRELKTDLIKDTIQVLQNQGLNPSIQIISEYTGIKEKTLRNHYSEICTFSQVYNISDSNNIVQSGKGANSKTTELIYSALEDLQNGEKITQERVAEYTGLSLRTVKSYWLPAFKDLVRTYNKNLRPEPVEQIKGEQVPSGICLNYHFLHMPLK